jgi:hypothetical protein
MSGRWLLRVSSPVVLAGLLALCPAGTPAEDQPPAQDIRRNARLGLPSDAKPDPSRHEDYLIERPQYVLSYNAELARPTGSPGGWSGPTSATPPAPPSSPTRSCPGASPASPPTSTMAAALTAATSVRPRTARPPPGTAPPPS